MTVETIENEVRAARLLLVEDNYGDVILMMRAFQDIETPIHVEVATSAEEALVMLRLQNEFPRRDLPDLILLDLNLPKISGWDLLHTLKQDVTLMHIPVIVLSSSGATQDVINSYNLHANGYIVKPSNPGILREIAGSIEQFWFKTAVMARIADVKRVGATA
jgi:CheY-like chemotaxis protein